MQQESPAQVAKTKEAILPQELGLEEGPADIEEALSTAQSELVELEAQRLALLAQCQRIQAVACSIKAFPDSLLSEIFSHFLPSDVSSGHQAAEVCTKWRKVVLRMPLFWTTLILPGCGHRDNPTFDHLWMHICHFAQRANDHPISLTIGKICRPIFDILIHSIFGHVIAHWQAISFPPVRLGQIQQVFSYYETFTDEADHLTSLSFTSTTLEDEDDEYDDDDDNESEIRPYELGLLAELRALRLDFDNLYFIQKRFDPPWPALTSLELHVDITSEEYLDILSGCRSLESLFIAPDDDIEDDSESGDVVQLDHLKQLTINSPNHPSTLLERLSAPNLEELYLNISHPVDDDNPAISTFLDRLNDAGSLRILHCYGWHEVPLGLFDTPALRNLVTLRLVEPFKAFATDPEDAADGSIFDLLAPVDDDGEDRLPLLENLEIIGYPQISEEECESLASLLQSRCFQGKSNEELEEVQAHSLRRVVLQMTPGQSYLGPWEGLSKLRKHGLLVYTL
ncbi:hypothetical protein CPB83DRAFT_843652 [Crepidotus variabilis]|uniref:F-box domain-containing protein n=1 Tax=Crepidotus variabilis TaxID=179855 RepID=A0A9P6EUB8_9AGAR|nr:hypothetical protein CPB83DRAFT_843652 [Crepidotus variabilis]